MRFLNEIKYKYEYIKDWIDGEQGYDVHADNGTEYNRIVLNLRNDPFYHLTGWERKTSLDW